MIPQKLNPEDEIRIIAPSSSLTRVRPDIYDSAFTFLKDKDKVSPDIPIVFGVDFGHVFPMFSFPIGGRVRLSVNNSIDLKIIEH